MSIVRVDYVLATGEEHARRLARAIECGMIPPMAATIAELVALRFLHPVPMIGSLIPFAVYTGLQSSASKRLDSGDWATEIARAFQERSHVRDT